MSPRPAEGTAFRYKALRPDGTRESGQLAASSARAALETLRGRGLSPLVLRPVGRGPISGQRNGPR